MSPRLMSRVSLPYTPLYRNPAGNCLTDTREFDQDAVAGGLDDAAFVFGDKPSVGGNSRLRRAPRPS